MKKLAALILYSLLTTLALRANVLLQDSTNYPYANGCIEGQGQWYAYSTRTGSTNALDALVTNNVLYISTTGKDSVGTPTNGWVNPGTITYASFTVNLGQLPQSPGYFCEFRDASGNSVCHLYNTMQGTVVPGTYRLGIGNFGTVHNDFPLDLSTGITYSVVLVYDTTVGSAIEGANLLINPSFQDYTNLLNEVYVGPGLGNGFVFGTDTTTATNLLNINISRIGFSPYANAGISNLIAGTDFTDVVTTNLPVIGIQPQSGTNYYGNPTAFYVAASGVDLTYQWYSSGGPLTDDGVNISGSTSDVLSISSVALSDNYYVVITDAYSNQVTSATAYETVITDPTAPFFPTNVVAVKSTNNLFTTGGFTNIALGTGPLYYQWYFAPTNTPNNFLPLDGQNSPGLSVFLADYTVAGNYFVTASNTGNGGSMAFGPTNSLSEVAPLQATILQLHNLMISQLPTIAANKGGTVTINSNNVVVSGYVTTYGGFGNTYTTFFIQDTNGYGLEVFLAGNGNTNTPPVGSYVTVTGPIKVFNTQLEITPTAISAIQTNPAPVFALQPVLCNGIFTDLATNGLGTNGILLQCSLVTFTNVYFYGSKLAPPPSLFSSNQATSSLYFNIGGTNQGGTNTLQCYQYCANYGTVGQPNYVLNPFNSKPIPTNCYQLTGVLLPYQGKFELCPSRLADYVTNPPVMAPTISRSKNGVSTVSVNPQIGSTYSVYTATNIAGPWSRKTSGLAYYPTNATFIETNAAKSGYYRVTSP